MLSDFIRAVAYQILAYIAQRVGAEGVPPGNPSTLPQWLKDLLEAYWDIVYWYRFGLPKIPIPDPEGPLPGPSPVSGSGNFVRDFLLLDILEHAMGDPHPQPNSWIQTLGNKQIRITAAVNLRDQLKAAIPQLEAEVERLERLQ